MFKINDKVKVLTDWSCLKDKIGIVYGIYERNVKLICENNIHIDATCINVCIDGEILAFGASELELVKD